jgi:hypothetical protein
MVPTYSLALIKKLIGEGRYRITNAALDSALDLGMDEPDIVECVCDLLTEDDFYKTMPAVQEPPLWQDVYRVEFRKVWIYLKLQINFANRAVVISFKLK